MKAKITPRKEMVLLYRPEQADAQEKLPQLLEEMGIEYRLVVQEELSMWTGELAGYLHRTPEQAERLSPAAGGDGDGRTQFQAARSAFKGCGSAGDFASHQNGHHPAQ